MSFSIAHGEQSERFTEALAILHYIRQNTPKNFAPLDNLQKALKGLCIVAIYAAFERSVNAIVEAAISEIASHKSKAIDFHPSLQSIIHYSKVQSVKDCGFSLVFDKSIPLFSAAMSDLPVEKFANPLLERLMNVDGNTLKWIAKLFAVPEFAIEGRDNTRLTALRERRNAVAHGRESASSVGEPYTIEELTEIYNVADAVISRFLLTMKDHCTGRHYLRNVV